MTYGLFRSMLFSFQVFGDFPIIFPFGFILVREYTLHDFNYFKFVEVCFMTKILFILVNVPWALEKNVYSAVPE